MKPITHLTKIIKLTLADVKITLPLISYFLILSFINSMLNTLQGIFRSPIRPHCELAQIKPDLCVDIFFDLSRDLIKALGLSYSGIWMYLCLRLCAGGGIERWLKKKSKKCSNVQNFYLFMFYFILFFCSKSYIFYIIILIFPSYISY